MDPALLLTHLQSGKVPIPKFLRPNQTATDVAIYYVSPEGTILWHLRAGVNGGVFEQHGVRGPNASNGAVHLLPERIEAGYKLLDEVFGLHPLTGDTDPQRAMAEVKRLRPYMERHSNYLAARKGPGPRGGRDQNFRPPVEDLPLWCVYTQWNWVPENYDLTVGQGMIPPKEVDRARKILEEHGLLASRSSDAPRREEAAQGSTEGARRSGLEGGKDSDGARHIPTEAQGSVSRRPNR